MNEVTLLRDGSAYRVNHEGEDIICERVTNIIKGSKPTPQAIQRWISNASAETMLAMLFETGLTVERARANLTQLKAEAWNAHKLVSDKALEIGTATHNFIEEYLTEGDSINLRTNLSPEVRTTTAAFLDFRDLFNPEPELIEETVSSPTLKVAGTIDFTGFLTDPETGRRDLWILDWKTSKSIYTDYKIQASIYWEMLRNTLPHYRRARLGIVRLKKDPNINYRRPYEFKEVTIAERNHYLKEFKLMNKLYQHRKKESEL